MSSCHSIGNKIQPQQRCLKQRIQPLQDPCPVGVTQMCQAQEASRETWAEMEYILALIFIIQISPSQQGAQLLTEG